MGMAGATAMDSPAQDTRSPVQESDEGWVSEADEEDLVVQGEEVGERPEASPTVPTLEVVDSDSSDGEEPPPALVTSPSQQLSVSESDESSELDDK